MICEKCEVEAILVCPCCDALVEEEHCEHLSPDDVVILVPHIQETSRRPADTTGGWWKQHVTTSP